ncbi:MAG TPA: helix-turn-helix domain-containing protein [Polyangiaceae bacterium]|nr:helix-turn-helix domain-containing protein [Polyangiaceae bacterium]
MPITEWQFARLPEVGGARVEARFDSFHESPSQKMLTKTLRDLERDGLVARRVHAVVPPRVDYKLTMLGEALGEAVCGIWTWVEKHMKDVERSRRAYDSKARQVPE